MNSGGFHQTHSWEEVGMRSPLCSNNRVIHIPWYTEHLRNWFLVEREALICGIYHFLWYKYFHHCQLQTTSDIAERKLGRDAT